LIDYALKFQSSSGKCGGLRARRCRKKLASNCASERQPDRNPETLISLRNTAMKKFII